MGRPRKYTSAAEKQHAYRDRPTRAQPPAPSISRPRRKTRPERLLAIKAELRDLADGYQHWLDAMPENQSETELAEGLKAIVEQLKSLADEVGDLDPPRGSGR